MGNQMRKSSSDMKLSKTYQDLLQMGFTEEMAFAAATKHRKSVTKAINYIETIDQNDNKMDIDNDYENKQEHKEDTNYVLSLHQCQHAMVTQCDSCIKIENKLRLYQLHNDKTQSFHEFIKGNNNNHGLTQLLDDYEHCIRFHDFEQMFDLISENVTCNLNECTCVKRNLNPKYTENDNDFNLDECIRNVEDIVCQQILDTIHTFYVHSFDLKMKLSQKDKQQITHSINKQKSQLRRNSRAAKASSFNGKTLLIQEMQKFIAKDDNDDEGNECGLYYESIANNKKFVLKVDDASNDDDDGGDGDEKKQKSPGNAEMIYTFGFPFYYWKDEQDELFISKAFPTLKNEMIMDKKMTVNAWNIIFKKAMIHCNKKYCKSIEANGDLCQRYNIKEGSHISIEHIIAILLYCNNTNVRSNLCQTFLKPKNGESLKKRNSLFANLSKLLYECVECYGTMIQFGSVKKLYHLVNRRLLFLSKTYSIKAPFSTTDSLEVALNYKENKGIIIEISTKDNCLHKYWDCRAWSDFTVESEYFFIGGNRNFEINGIMDAHFGYDYSDYMKPINIINEMFKGQGYLNDVCNDHTFSAATIECCKCILQNDQTKCKVIPRYIWKLFNHFAYNFTQIHVNCYWMNRECDDQLKEYKGYNCLKSSFYIDVGDDSMILFPSLDKICELFVNVNTVIIDGGFKKNELSFCDKQMDYVYKCLSSDSYYFDKLKTIFIQNIDKETSMSAIENKEKYIQMFKKIGFEVRLFGDRWFTIKKCKLQKKQNNQCAIKSSVEKPKV